MEAQSAEDREALRAALQVIPEDPAASAHVHGFHSYPARLHPTTAARCVAAWSKAGDWVLDPFCGSGTVAVEARLCGRKAWGVDLNPLAVELAWCKTRGSSASERQELLRSAAQVAELAEQRRREKAGPTRRYGQADRELFDPHVLLELDGLASGFARLGDSYTRRALQLVLSSTLTKVSRRAGDASERVGNKRIAGGFAIRFFTKKTRELADRLAAFQEALPARAPEAELRLADARSMKHIRSGRVGLIVSSPPYPGVYDYHAHHAVRLRWLGLDDRGLRAGEIGARREFGRLRPGLALQRWHDELGASLREMCRVVAPKGSILLVMADAALGTEAVRANEWIADLASKVGLRLCGQASQRRPDFHARSARVFGRGKRREHLLLLRRS